MGPFRIEERIPSFETEARLVAAFPNLQPTQTTHRMSSGIVLATYDLPELRFCCLPDEQGHKHGAVVVTDCGLTLAIGEPCGKRWVPNFKESVARASNVNAVVDTREGLERIAGLVARVGAVADTVAELMIYRDCVERYVPAFMLAAREYATHFKTYARFLRHDYDAKRVAQLMKRLRVIGSDESSLTLDTAKSIRSRLVAAGNDVEDLIAWVHEGKAFMGEDARWLVIRTTETEHRFMADGTDVLFKVGGTWRRCGTDGLGQCTDFQVQRALERAKREMNARARAKQA